MKNLIRQLLKFAAYGAATVVVLLAIAVGLFRLFLPRLPEYQSEIKDWASTAIGQRVDFAAMDARWGLQGPELNFYDAELFRADSDARLIAAEEVSVGVSLIRLLLDRTFVIDFVRVRDTSIELQELADGGWLIQGQSLQELIPEQAEDPASIETVSIVGEGIELQVLRADWQQPVSFDVTRIAVERDHQRTAIDLAVGLPAALGESMRVFATQMLAADDHQEPWNISVVSDNTQFAGWSEIIRDPLHRLSSGTGHIDAALAIDEAGIQSISASVEIASASLNDGPQFDISGRLALNNDAHGWLLAADDLRLRSASGEWPQTSIRVESSIGETGNIELLDARASYLKLDDISLFQGWLSAEQQDFFTRHKPDGQIRNLVATLSSLGGTAPEYAVTAELDRAGWKAFGKVPGVRGFTGSLRADQDGGLVSIDAHDLSIAPVAWMKQAIDVDALTGTVIWRRSDRRTTILSDSIALSNAALESQSSVEIIIVDEQSPIVDFSSTWQISDIVAAKAYIPERIMAPKLYRWFQEALLGGSISAGTTRLTGPLDRFPFDNGEGQFLVEAHAENLTLQYLPTFPPSMVRDLDVVLDNTHLYSKRNRSQSLGNVSVDSRVDILDLRDPVLTIKALSRGSLATIRDFAQNSPIDTVFGGQLERISVAGDASLALDLTVPLRNSREFKFTADINSSDGTLAIAGLDAPITGLSGSVTVQKDSISSQGLSGFFLGGNVAIELVNAGPDMPAYRIIANATGSAQADNVISELGLPLAGRLTGVTDYEAQVLFPRAGQDPPTALAVRVNTPLTGFSIDLPAPFGKPAGVAQRLRGELTFLPGGAQIESRGHLQERLTWDLAFLKLDDAWDFDRGTLRLGPGEPDQPEVRGLHVQGQTPLIRVEDWLALSRGEAKQLGAAERIRSVDLVVERLYFLGQELVNHRVRVDRSARDWLVQLNGEEVTGSVFVPYDFTPASTLVLDMERLVLPGSSPALAAEPAPARSIDPRDLPSISLRTQEFGLGDRRFGAVTADFLHTGDGLVADTLVAEDATFTIEGRARWVVDPLDPLGSRSYLDATLSSSDVVQTMARLGYEPGIVSDDLHMDLDMDWSGGPRSNFLGSLDGEVKVRLGTGQLDEVEPGAGRMFGLMSIVALPRRLSLDFRDVFQKGFGFDRISGSFRIDDGTAYTCDLSLEGPAADIGIIGKADLVAGSYAQTAVVNANVGSTLPVVGALAAGPQVAAAMFLLSQIFKKPLKDIGQVYYSMNGSWDSPVVESSNAAVFAASGKLAGCLAETE